MTSIIITLRVSRFWILSDWTQTREFMCLAEKERRVLFLLATLFATFSVYAFDGVQGEGTFEVFV